MGTNRFTPAQVFKRFMAGESFDQIGNDFWDTASDGEVRIYLDEHPTYGPSHWASDQLRRYLQARDRRRKGKK
jgi:hypothetical protein